MQGVIVNCVQGVKSTITLCSIGVIMIDFDWSRLENTVKIDNYNATGTQL